MPQLINPATEAVILEWKEDSKDQIRAKFETVRTGQPAWALVNLEEKIRIIERFGNLVLENLEKFARDLSLEVGKPISQARNEIKGAHNRIEFFPKHIAAVIKEKWVVEDGETKELLRSEPLGVIANISAWNYPYNVGYNVLIPALLTGNGILYKPSEYAIQTGINISEMLWQAGVPENVFQLIKGGPEAGEALLQLPIDGYFFTGSYKTGKHIAQKIAGKMVPVQLELGGKDPLYVAEDVPDIKQAAVNAAEGAFYNTGQSCCAVERIYVHQKIYDRFLDAFLTEVKSYKTGDPLQEDTFIGPLTRPQQRETLIKQIEQAVTMGATLRTGGKKMAGNGYFLEPAVLTEVNHRMDIMKEESFGPVIGIMAVESDQQAVELMNDTEYGLTSAIFTASRDRAEKILAQMKCGTVYWNCCDRVSPNLPWSGRNQSGTGSTLGEAGIRAFVKPKAWHLRTNYEL